MGLLHHEKPILALECLQLQLTQAISSGGVQTNSSNSDSGVSPISASN
jgi:hypothetical protein